MTYERSETRQRRLLPVPTRRGPPAVRQLTQRRTLTQRTLHQHTNRVDAERILRKSVALEREGFVKPEGGTELHRHAAATVAPTPTPSTPRIAPSAAPIDTSPRRGR